MIEFILFILAVVGLVGAHFLASRTHGPKRLLRFTMLTLPTLFIYELLLTPATWMWIAAIVLGIAGVVASNRGTSDTIQWAVSLAGIAYIVVLGAIMAIEVFQGLELNTAIMTIAVIVALLTLLIAFTIGENLLAIAGAAVVLGVLASFLIFTFGDGETQIDEQASPTTTEQMDDLTEEFDSVIEAQLDEIQASSERIDELENTLNSLETENEEQAALLLELSLQVDERDELIEDLNTTVEELEGRAVEIEINLAQTVMDGKRAEVGSRVAGISGARSVNVPAGVRRFKGNLSEFGLPGCTYVNEPGYLSQSLLSSHLANLPEATVLECNGEFVTVMDGDVYILGDEVADVWQQARGNGADWEFASQLDSSNRNQISAQLTDDNELRVEALSALDDAVVNVYMSCLPGSKTSQIFRGHLNDEGEIVYDEIVTTQVFNRECARDIVLVREYDVDGDGKVDATTYRRIHCGFQRLVPHEPPPPPTSTTTTTAAKTTTTTVPVTTTTIPGVPHPDVRCVGDDGQVVFKSDPASYVIVEDGELKRAIPSGADFGLFSDGTYSWTYGPLTGSEYVGVPFVVDCDVPVTTTSTSTTTTTQPSTTTTSTSTTTTTMPTTTTSSTTTTTHPTTTTTAPSTTTTTVETTTTTKPEEELRFKVKVEPCIPGDWVQQLIIYDIEGDWDKFEIGELDVEYTGQQTITVNFPGDLVKMIKILGYPANGDAPVEHDVYLLGECIQPDFKPELVCDTDTGMYVLRFHQKDGADNVVGEFISFTPPLDGTYTLPGSFEGRVLVVGDAKYGPDVERYTNLVDGSCKPPTTTTTEPPSTTSTTQATTTTTQPSTTTTSTSTTTTTMPSTTTTSSTTTTTQPSTTTTSTSTTTTTMPSTTTTTAPTTTTTAPTTTTTVPETIEDFKVELNEISPSVGGGYELRIWDIQGDFEKWEYYDPIDGQWKSFTIGNWPKLSCKLSSSVEVRGYTVDGSPKDVISHATTSKPEGGECPEPTTTTQPGTSTTSSSTTTTSDPRPHPTSTTTTTLPQPPQGEV